MKNIRKCEKKEEQIGPEKKKENKLKSATRESSL